MLEKYIEKILKEKLLNFSTLFFAENVEKKSYQINKSISYK